MLIARRRAHGASDRLLSCLSFALLLLIAAAIGAVAPPTASASPVTCGPGQVLDPGLKTCIIVVADPGGGGGGGSKNGAGGVSHGGGKAKCTYGKEIPCKTVNGYWSQDKLCYVSPSPAKHGPDDPIWEGHYGTGGIYLCYDPFVGGTNNFEFWAATAPAGPAAPPDPRQLAQQAIAAMNLHAVQIGIVPELLPGRIGVIGLPTWMWARQPAANTMGPITRSASARGYTATATAKVTKVVWNMGDGSSVTCRGPGTPYEDKYGKKSSPTCGHTYVRQGRYTVTATSYWTVTWAGIGQTGTIPLDLSNSAAITMGEVQVITR